MHLLGLVVVALLHLFSQPTKALTLTPGNIPSLSQPSAPSVSTDSGPELDPNGRG
jgi:hypothetical protein